MIHTKAFTILELIIVMAVSAILLGFGGFEYHKAYRNNQIDRAESDIRDMSLSFQNYLLDYGKIVLASDINYKNSVKEVVQILNDNYMNYGVELASVAEDNKSFEIITKNKTDPWNNQYKINIYTYDGDDKSSIDGLIIISSAGEDGRFNDVYYKNSNYGDDVIAVIEPN